ncbi:MAG: TetR/AcrR family transcriptional regulator [Sphingobium sp.]
MTATTLSTTTKDSPFRTPEQRESDRAAKRHALLLAAARMFNTRGFHATSLDDVASSVGVTKPTIYHYLGNKEQVLIECMTIGLNQLQDAAATARSEPGTAMVRLRGFLERYAEVNMTEFGQCVIRTGDELLSPEGLEKLRALKRPIDAALRAFIVEGTEDGSIAPHDPMMLAFTLAGAVNWISRWYDEEGPLSPTEIAERVAGILASGFAPRS